MSQFEISHIKLDSIREHDGAIVVVFNPPQTICVKNYRGKKEELTHCHVAIFYPKFEVDEGYTCRSSEVIQATFECHELDEYNQVKPINYTDDTDGKIKHKWEAIDSQYLSLKEIVILRSEVQKIIEMALSF